MDESGRQGPNVGPNIGRGVLQAIFAVFLGLMITAVVGVGVYTFHPNPAEDAQEQINDLYEQRAQIEGCGPGSVGPCEGPDQMSAAERAQIAAIDAQIEELGDDSQAQRESWGQSTSVILIVIATALMAVSLLLGESVTVLSNGILLGGLFTMLYGVGWGLAAGNSVTRFLVLVAALAVSLALGYVKFVRGRHPAGEGGTRRLPPRVQVSRRAPRHRRGWPRLAPELAELTARVADLERRLAAAAAGLGAEGRARSGLSRRSRGTGRANGSLTPALDWR